MEDYTAQDLIHNWLTKKSPDDPVTIEYIQNCLSHFNTRRRLIAFHSLVFQAAQEIDSNQNIVIPEKVLSHYGRLIIKSPLQYIIQLWKVFLKQNELNSIFIQLFAAFLNHLKINDESLPLALSSEVYEYLEKTKNILVRLNLELIEDEKCLANALNLCHAWGQLIVIKHCYNLNCNLNVSSDLEWYDITLIHNYLDTSVWFKIFSQIKDKDDINLLNGQALVQLLIQKIILLAKVQSVEAADQRLANDNILKVLKIILSIIQTNSFLFHFVNLSNIVSLMPINLRIKYD